MTPIREAAEKWVSEHGRLGSGAGSSVATADVWEAGYRQAIEDAAKACTFECARRVEAVKAGTQYPSALLGEASGATHCARAVRELAE